jgi:CheY-like chemotaxis protein
VFNEIVQFNANKQQGGGGSGLGLWISKKIVELHGGRVGLSSEGEGKGCTFFVEIPMMRSARKDTADYGVPVAAPIVVNAEFSVPTQRKTMRLATNASNPSSFTQRKANPMRILAVDDSNVNRKVLAKALGFQGHDVTEADNGQRAVEICLQATEEEDPFEVILMDSCMPELSGPEAARVMRSRGVKALIIGLTGNTSAEDTDEYMAAGADAVLVKPMDMKKLQSTIDELKALKAAGSSGVVRRFGMA